MDSLLGGYDNDFVDRNAAAEFDCPICLLVARKVQKTKCCGGYFCEHCIESLSQRSNSGNFTCPKCRALLEEEEGIRKYFPDEFASAKINQLAVRCPNKCDWVGELQDLDDHIQSQCQKQKVPCGCGVEIYRYDLDTHLKRNCALRKIFCSYCKCPVEFRSHKHHMQTVCPKYRISCSNRDCESHIQRKNMNSHLQRCRYRMIPCPNECGQTLQHIKHNDHLESECLKRTVSCQFCNLVGLASFINGIHINKECQHVLVPCLNEGCEEGMKRGFKKEHLDICPKQLVKCKYAGICNCVMKKEEEDHHYHSKMDEHLRSMYSKLACLAEKDLQHEKIQRDLCEVKNEYAADTKRLKKQICNLNSAELIEARKIKAISKRLTEDKIDNSRLNTTVEDLRRQLGMVNSKLDMMGQDCSMHLKNISVLTENYSKLNGTVEYLRQQLKTVDNTKLRLDILEQNVYLAVHDYHQEYSQRLERLELNNNPTYLLEVATWNVLVSERGLRLQRHQFVLTRNCRWLVFTVCIIIFIIVIIYKF